MALRWSLLLALMPLLAAEEMEKDVTGDEENLQETGKRWSLFSLQVKVLLLPCCTFAVYLHCRQHTAALSEAGGDVRARDRDMRASIGEWWGEAPQHQATPSSPCTAAGSAAQDGVKRRSAKPTGVPRSKACFLRADRGCFAISSIRQKN